MVIDPINSAPVEVQRIAFQLAIARLREAPGPLFCDVRHHVLDRDGAIVFPLVDHVSYLPQRLKCLSEVSGLGAKALIAQAHLLHRGDKLPGFDSVVNDRLEHPDELTASRLEVLRLRLTNIIDEGIQAGFISNAVARTSFQTFLESTLVGLLQTTHLTRLEPVLGLAVKNVRRVWVDVELLDVAGTDLLTRPSATDVTGLHGQTASLFIEALENLALIVGDPGAGKSTLLTWLATEIARGVFARFSLGVFVPLKDYAQRLRDGGTIGLLEYIAEAAGVTPTDLTAVRQCLEFLGRFGLQPSASAGGLLLLIDGWDEVPIAQRPQVARAINAIHGVVPSLITSRPMVLQPALIVERVVRIGALSLQSMYRLMSVWLNESQSQELARHLDAEPELQSLARNPFILTAFCALVSDFRRSIGTPLPGSRAMLYEAVLKAMIEHHQELGKARQQVERLAKFLLADAPQAPRLVFAEPEVSASGAAADLLENVLRPSRIIVAIRTDAFVFIHPTIHEYLAACHLQFDFKSLSQLLSERAHAPSWNDVLRLLCGGVLASGKRNELDLLAGALAKLAVRIDRFNVLTTKLALLLGEGRVSDGGQNLLGIDLRPLLWKQIRGLGAEPRLVYSLTRLDRAYLFSRLRDLEGKAHEDALRFDILSRLDAVDFFTPAVESSNERAITTRPSLRITGLEERNLPHTLRRISDVSRMVTVAECQQILVNRNLPVAQHSTAVKILGELGDSAAAAALERAFWLRGDLWLRREIINALGRTQNRTARDALSRVVAAFFNTDVENAQALSRPAIAVLSAFPPASATELLMAVKDDEQAPVADRVGAIRTLRHVHVPEISASLALLAGSAKDSEVIVACLEVLADRADPPLAASIARHLSSSVRDVRVAASKCLVHAARHSRIHPLFDVFDSGLRTLVDSRLGAESEDERLTAIAAAGLLREWGAERLRKLLTDAAAPLTDRAAAATALADTGIQHESHNILRAIKDWRGKSASPNAIAAIETATRAVLNLDSETASKHQELLDERTLARWALETGSLVYPGVIIGPEEANTYVPRDQVALDRLRQMAQEIDSLDVEQVDIRLQRLQWIRDELGLSSALDSLALPVRKAELQILQYLAAYSEDLRRAIDEAQSPSRDQKAVHDLFSADSMMVKMGLDSSGFRNSPALAAIRAKLCLEPDQNSPSDEKAHAQMSEAVADPHLGSQRLHLPTSDAMTEDELFDRLKRCLPSQLDVLEVKLRLPTSHLLGRNEAPAARAAVIWRLLQEPEGSGLAILENLLLKEVRPTTLATAETVNGILRPNARGKKHPLDGVFVEIVDLIRPLLSQDRRVGLLRLAFAGDAGAKVLDQIDFTGANDIFAPSLVHTLFAVGEIEPGRLALVVLLESLAGRLGIDQQQRINNLISRLTQTQSVSSQPPSTEAHVVQTVRSSMTNAESLLNKPRPDILLVTVNKHETKAVHDAFLQATGKNGVPSSFEERVYINLGTINGTSVYHALSEMGPGSIGAMQQTVDKAIRALDPGAVIAIGVAFGVNSAKQKIGEILLSRQLRPYDLQRVGAQLVLRDDKPHAATRLINHFAQFEHAAWQGATVHSGVILSGAKLIDDVDYKDQLLTFEPEAIGGEMEGSGLYVSSHEHKVDWIVIKAICDWADGNKNVDKEERQKLASANAVSFLIQSLTFASLAHVSPTGPQRHP